MAIFKQPIKLTYPDGSEVIFESVKALSVKTGYTRAGIWYALERGYFKNGQYKNIKVEKI